MLLKIGIISLIFTMMGASSLKASSPLSWINEQNTTIVEDGDGWNFTSQARGDSARLKSTILLDGFSFDYKFTNASIGKRAGFYFNTDGSHILDKNLCTFTFAPGFADGGKQTRFGIYPTDVTTNWFQAQNYPLNQTGIVGELGFGLDHTLVLDASVDLEINFTFKKIGPYYKITIRQLKNDLIWPTNANYTPDANGNYVTTYVETTKLPSTDGYVYFHEFGYSDSAATIVHIGNIKEATANSAKVTYHYNQFIYEGNVKTPVTKEIIVELNSLLEEPTEPVNVGYKFAGWYADPYFTTKWDFKSNKAINDINLYAKWVAEESGLNPGTKDGKINGYVVKLSTPVFVTICILGGLLLIAAGILLAYLIKKAKLKSRGNKLLK